MLYAFQSITDNCEMFDLKFFVRLREVGIPTALDAVLLLLFIRCLMTCLPCVFKVKGFILHFE